MMFPEKSWDKDKNDQACTFRSIVINRECDSEHERRIHKYFRTVRVYCRGEYLMGGSLTATPDVLLSCAPTQ